MLTSHYLRFSLLFGIALISACTQAPKAPPIPTYRTDIAAYNPSDYNYAYHYFYQAAQKGDPIAEDNLGKIYADGRGVPQDEASAVTWYTKAAQQHNPDAALNLGVAKLYGRGTDQSETEACQWFNVAKNEGNSYAEGFYHDNCLV